MLFNTNRQEQRDNQKIQVYLEEYKLVVEKITSLSLKFSGGSYIVPISVVAGFASLTPNSLYTNLLIAIIPIILTFFLYNHVRYMALQFKLSGYAKHLELQINKLVKENSLLWENAIARGNNQNLYEGAFLGLAYTLIIGLIFYLAYGRLNYMAYNNDISLALLLVIVAIYYFSAASLVFFILFFMNEHNNAFHMAQSAFCNNDDQKKKASSQRRWGYTVLKVSVIGLILSMLPLSLLPFVLSPIHTDSLPIEEYDYVVVLGNKSPQGQPSADMQSRLQCLTSSLRDSTDVPILVLSGGNGEALLMYEYLKSSCGSMIETILECESSNTYENIINTRQIVSGRILVITSDYHVFRTKMITNQLNLDYDICPAKTEGITIFKAVKECYSVYLSLFYV